MLSIEQVQEFNDFFTRGIFDIAEPLDQSWINLKRAAAPPPPTDTKAFGRVMRDAILLVQILILILTVTWGQRMRKVMMMK